MRVKGLAIAIIIGALLILGTGIDASGLDIPKLVPVVYPVSASTNIHSLCNLCWRQVCYLQH